MWFTELIALMMLHQCMIQHENGRAPQAPLCRWQGLLYSLPSNVLSHIALHELALEALQGWGDVLLCQRRRACHAHADVAHEGRQQAA